MNGLNWKKWSLAVELSLAMMTLVVVTVVSVTLLSIRREQETFHAELENQAALMLSTLSAAGADSLYYLDLDRLSAVAERLQKHPAVVLARFYDSKGRVIADPYAESARSFDIDPFGQRLVESDTTVFEWQSDRLVAGQAVTIGPYRLGAVGVGLSTVQLKTKIATIRRQGFSIALATIVVGIALAVAFSRYVTNPLRDLTRAAVHVADGDLSHRVAIRGEDELAMLASAFNRMTAQLQQTLVQMHQEIEGRKQAEEALQRAKTEIQRRLEEQIALREAGTVITSTLELTHVLNHIAEQMCQAIGATSSYICSFDQQAMTSTVLAEFLGPHACEQEQVSDLGIIYDESDHRFLEPLLAGQPWVDHLDDPDLPEYDRHFMEQYGAQSILYIPLYVRSQTIGYAELWESRRRREFTPEENTICQAIAQNATIAIENARLHTETRKRLKEQIALRAAGAVISSTLDLNVMLTRIAEQMGRAVDATSAYISRHDPETWTSTVLAEYIGPHASDKERVSDLGTTYSYEEGDAQFLEIMEAGQHDISHVSVSDSFEAERAHMQQYGAETILYIPLRVRDELIGYAELWESRRRRAFTSEEITLCQGIVQQAAIALENAQLYERAQQEIAERKQAEEQIKASLREKEVLLKEIHHRVKNNLQIISSLLYLQSKTTEDKESIEMFQDCRNRVRSMALVHEQLYRSKDLAGIDFAGYVHSLARYLFRSYGVHPNVIQLKISADGVFLDIDTAIPCGLIINELVSNCLKHAFPNGKEGEIRIELCPDDDSQFTLMVSDNGVGFPQDLDFRNTTSLGLQLVNNLVTQLEGTLDLDRRGGTAFKITFPI